MKSLLRRSLLTLCFICSALLVGGYAFGNEPAASGDEEATLETQIVEQFIEAFNHKDVDMVMSFFTADAIYHNMPGPPAEGTEAIRKLIESYANAASKIDWEILAIAQTGTTVLTERVDRFVFGEKELTLPVMGTFEFRDGKISAWRDYFDMATWTRQMQD